MRKSVFSSPCSIRRGFTMIELLIVVAIIIIIGSLPLVMAQRLDETRVRLEDRAEADRRSNAAMRLWREDVRAAVEVRVDAGADARADARVDGEVGGELGRIEIDRYDGTRAESGESNDSAFSLGPVTVVYEVSPDGSLVRRVEGSGSLDRELCTNVRELEFRRVGEGFRAAWSVEISDGLRTWHRDKSGYATPLVSISSAEVR